MIETPPALGKKRTREQAENLPISFVFDASSINQPEKSTFMDTTAGNKDEPMVIEELPKAMDLNE